MKAKYFTYGTLVKMVEDLNAQIIVRDFDLATLTEKLEKELELVAAENDNNPGDNHNTLCSKATINTIEYNLVNKIISKVCGLEAKDAIRTLGILWGLGYEQPALDGYCKVTCADSVRGEEALKLWAEGRFAQPDGTVV